MPLTRPELRELLEEKYDRYCRSDFLTDDPILIPHMFENRRDREISGLIAATIAWGQRPTIIRNAKKAMHLMGYEPHRFVMEHSELELDGLRHFVHRTFNGDDLIHFILALRNIYQHHDSLENVFLSGMAGTDLTMRPALMHFKQAFFSIPHQVRTEKHVADPSKGSSAKRLNMFLRWMVRDDGRGVDLGLWKHISPAVLSCPLDVHSGRVARQLGLLERKQDDWKAVEELDAALRSFDPNDPVKYDFALFGMGVFEHGRATAGK
ncbi:MAG: TIGR02757 family protein [Flavobacteriales bacterium]|nr:TIGR02757 family protein [Flavobacteriales bacterium]